MTVAEFSPVSNWKQAVGFTLAVVLAIFVAKRIPVVKNWL